jgi:hypothetical protein
MLNGLALRNGFEGAPKVRKNRFQCSATAAIAVREGAEKPKERPLRHSVLGKADDGRSCPFGLAEAEENPHSQPEVVLDVCS